MTADAADSDFDAQDQAEVLDETNLTEDGEDIANFDEIADVFDSTQVDGDADEDAALEADDYGPDDIDDIDTDEDELEPSEEAYEPEVGLGSETAGHVGGFNEDAGGADDIEGLNILRDADSVEGGEDDFTNFQSRCLSDQDIAKLGYADPKARRNSGG